MYNTPSTPTPDKWSGEETRLLQFGVKASFLPFAGHTWFVVFLYYPDGTFKTVHLGTHRATVFEIYMRL